MEKSACLRWADFFYDWLPGLNKRQGGIIMHQDLSDLLRVDQKPILKHSRVDRPEIELHIHIVIDSCRGGQLWINSCDPWFGPVSKNKHWSSRTMIRSAAGV